jgi:hypothetical protein
LSLLLLLPSLFSSSQFGVIVATITIATTVATVVTIVTVAAIALIAPVAITHATIAIALVVVVVSITVLAIAVALEVDWGVTLPLEENHCLTPPSSGPWRTFDHCPEPIALVTIALVTLTCPQMQETMLPLVHRPDCNVVISTQTPSSHCCNHCHRCHCIMTISHPACWYSLLTV